MTPPVAESGGRGGRREALPSGGVFSCPSESTKGGRAMMREQSGHPAAGSSPGRRSWLMLLLLAACPAAAGEEPAVISLKPVVACPGHRQGPSDETLPPVLTLPAAVGWTLQYNPELATLRQEHGIAAAGIVIARTYPYNPVTQSTVLGVTGPPSAGITNRVANHHSITLDVEIRGQRFFRQQAAFAALRRTDWEIA